MNCKCPHCAKDFSIALEAHVPKEQTVSMVITYEGEYFEAQTLARMIYKFCDLYILVAKEMDVKMRVFIKEFIPEPGKVTIRFLMATERPANENIQTDLPLPPAPE